MSPKAPVASSLSSTPALAARFPAASPAASYAEFLAASSAVDRPIFFKLPSILINIERVFFINNRVVMLIVAD